MLALDPADVLIELWREAKLDDEALDEVVLTGNEPVLPSSFAVGTAAQASIAAAALAAAELWRLRNGRRQRVSVEMRDAAIEFRSERYLRIEGKEPDDHHDRIMGLYRCGDGRWVRLHTALPHHRDGLLKLLGCEHDKAAVQRALEKWGAEAHETTATEAGLVVTACRSFAEWDEHSHGRAVAKLRLFSIDKIGDAPAEKFAQAPRPLSGIKVLDLTRIIAGPVCGRTLAAHGADVLLVTGAHLPSMLPLVIDTGRGKLSAEVDLRQPGGRETLANLARHRATGPARWQGTASAPKNSRNCGPVSSMPHCRPMATTVPGRCVAASIHSCKRRADLMSRRRKHSARPSRSTCRRKCSTMPAAISWHSA